MTPAPAKGRGRPPRPCPPLDAGRRAALAACAEWVRPWVLAVVPRSLLRAAPFEDVINEAWVLCARAAALWRPEKGCAFRTFAMNAVKMFLPSRVRRLTRGWNVWAEMPQLPDGNGPVSEFAPDHRRAEVDPLLRAWCSPDFAAQRARLDWRARVVLYLRFVECLTLDEVGPALGVSRERVRQIEGRAAAKLADARLTRAIRRQLDGRAG